MIRIAVCLAVLLCMLPSVSRGDAFAVPRLEGVKVDGDPSDWGESGFRIELMHRFVKGEAGEPRGDRQARLAWDDAGLLVLTRVRDEAWVETARNAWQYDSVELYLAASRKAQHHRYQVVIAPGMSEPLSEPAVTVYDKRPGKHEPIEVDVARTRDGQTAVIEARLPWAELGIKPNLGREVAFQIMINDNDQPGSGYGQTSHDVWFAALGAAQDASKMHTLRLAAQAGSPYQARVELKSPWSQKGQALVLAAPTLAGESAELRSGERVVARRELKAMPDAPAANVALPLDEMGEQAATIWLAGQRLARIDARPDHPFLICTRAQFPELRARAEREPWKTMAADAMKRAEAGFSGNFRGGLQRYLGAVALAYILDKGNERARAEQVRDAVLLLEQADFDPSKKWIGTVPPMGAAFTAILALDIVYSDLTAEEIERCGQMIETQIGKIKPRGAWLAARLGTHGTWALFANPADGRTVDFRRRFIQPFYRNYLQQMTPDGVNTVSPGYAFARLGSDDGRPQKTGFADVLEFTGVDQRYYDHPKLEAFYRWLFSHSVTPAKEFHMFGDVAPQWGWPNAALLWRVGRFDRQAAAYAAWLLEGKDPPGHIFSYILMQEPLPEKQVPQSHLFMQGEAVFREPEDSPMSFGAALYNITEGAEWHTHEEVNAISVAAFGNRLVVNGGWLGDDMRPPWRNNTLAINRERHKKMIGAGLSEGLLAEGFDYACGFSGKALGDDAFHRSLIMVHRDEPIGGYFLVFDEVDADPGESVQHYLQTACETEVDEVMPRQRYHAPIDHHAEVEGVSMSVFYATEPDSVKQDIVASGFLERSPRSGKHVRLEAEFDTNDQGDARLLTVLVPHKDGQPQPKLTRVAADGVVGAQLDHGGGVRDLVAVTASDAAGTPQSLHGVTFQAAAALTRQNAEQIAFYFVRHGTQLRHGSVGFDSDRPVSLFMRGLHGEITGPAASMTFHHPDLRGVQIDGKATMGTEPGRVPVEVPKGRHEITLIVDE